MKSRSLLICLLLAMPAVAPGASKEILELQRDIAQLQQQIKELQRSQDEKFSGLLEVARQSVQSANQASTNVAVISASIEKNLRDQTEKVSTPVAGLSARLNEMGGELRTVTQAVQDLTQLMARLQAQLTDMDTNLAPSRTGGAFVWAVRLQPSLRRPVDAASLSANLLGVARTSLRDVPGLASPPSPLRRMPVG